MRIVDLQTLRTMPEGVLFQKYDPCYFGSMSIFGGAYDSDFLSCEFGSGPIECNSSEQFVDRCDDMAERSASYPVDLDKYGRDGCFEPDQLFAIWESADVRALIAKLEAALAQGIDAHSGATEGRDPKDENPVA